MSQAILIDGDTVLFLPAFGVATVVVRPGQIAGSGPATLGGKAICVAGDEGRVSVPGCVYTTAVHAIPGTGTLKIAALAGDQTSTHTHTGGKAVLLKGGQFTAAFEVQSPAQQPPPGPGSPVPDATPQYSGHGQFVTANATVTSA